MPKPKLRFKNGVAIGFELLKGETFGKGGQLLTQEDKDALFKLECEVCLNE